MATPNTNYSNSLTAATIEYWAAHVAADQVHGTTPLLAWLKKHQKPYGGGKKIVEPVIYNTSSLSQWFAKGGTFDTSEEEILDNAEYNLYNVGIPIVFFDQDDMDNASTQQQVDLAETKSTWARAELAAKIQSTLWNTSQGTNEPIPIPVMVDASSTVGNIASGSHSWWQANVDSDSEALSTAKMDNIYNSCMRYNQNQEPDAIFTTQTLYEGYAALGGPLVRVAAANMPAKLNLGFDGMAFRNSAIYLDFDCVATNMYFLNGEALRWRPHTSCAKGYKSQIERAHNTPAVVHLLWQRASLTCNKRRALGALTTKTAP